MPLLERRRLTYFVSEKNELLFESELQLTNRLYRFRRDLLRRRLEDSEELLRPAADERAHLGWNPVISWDQKKQYEQREISKMPNSKTSNPRKSRTTPPSIIGKLTYYRCGSVCAFDVRTFQVHNYLLPGKSSLRSVAKTYENYTGTLNGI